MFKCSYCGKENPDQSTKCSECGTAPANDSDDPEASLNEESEDPGRAAGKKRMMQGTLWFLGGSFVTLFSYMDAASSTSYYIVAWGALLYGAVEFFQGWLAATGRVKPNCQAQDLLNLAAQFESAAPAKAVALYEEVAKQFPGTRASEEAQRNIRTLTSHQS